MLLPHKNSPTFFLKFTLSETELISFGILRMRLIFASMIFFMVTW